CQDPGGDAAHLCQRIAISYRRPWRIARALAKEDAIARRARPMLQPIADAARGGPQGRSRPDKGRAVATPLGDDGGCRDSTVGSVTADGGHRHGFLPRPAGLQPRCGPLTIMLGGTIVVVNNNLSLTFPARYKNNQRRRKQLSSQAVHPGTGIAVRS